eukprot:TRINITY_DN41382_c0_g1_i1.p1 TRINITY_DN41382_c0_g1~~TRINITY_DN41382_c0_g1_i1.p1  ORF type:complete len:335 (+),score=51.80 TRINITY_DN41382_c0_g1_i1:70-1074(+)
MKFWLVASLAVCNVRADQCRAEGDDKCEVNRSRCPLFEFEHLFKAGGNSARKLFERLGMSSYSGPQQIEASWTPEEGIVLTGAPKISMDKPEPDRTFRVGMIRSPCDYLLAVWAFQRVPGKLDRNCAHSYGMCKCLEARMPHGVKLEQVLPVNDVNFTALSDQPWRLAEGQLSKHHIDTDRKHFSQWLHLMAGNKIHLLSMRFARHISKYGNDDCPASLSRAEETQIEEAIAQERKSHSHYSCLLRTEFLHRDIENCMRAWAMSCESTLSQKLLDYFESRFENSSWQSPLAEKYRNAGRHENCSEFVSPEDQEFVWHREKKLAMHAGYSVCCHS